MIVKLILTTIFLIGLVYLIWPGPESILDIPVTPNSMISTEPGDTVQNENIKGIYSDYNRLEVMDFFAHRSFSYLQILGFRIPPIRLNLPPEEAWTTVREQVKTTYLEELIYPFRDTLYINGFEPISEEGKPFDSSSVPIYEYGKFHFSKTTLRYYPSEPFIRVLFYTLSWISLITIWVLLRKALKEK